MDRAVPPGDDFYAYASGGWMKSTVIPPDRASYDAGGALEDQVLAQTRALLEGAAGSGAAAGTDAQRVGDYYASFVDEAGIESKGLAPLQGELAAISAIHDRAGLARALGETVRADVDPLNLGTFSAENLFGLWVAPDFDDPGRYAAYLLQGGLGLPERDYYLSSDAEMVSIRAKYLDHLVAVEKLLGAPDAAARAGRILALETSIARAHASLLDSEDVHKGNNVWQRGDFASKAPGLDWGPFFDAAGLGAQSRFFVWQPAAFTGLSALVAREPIATWKEYLALRAVEHDAAYLPKAFGDEAFAFFGKVLSGTPAQRERWKRAIRATNAALPDGVGKLYVAKHFPPEAKARATAMVTNIVAAFGRRIDALTWMAPATRTKAKEKLSTLYVGVGYPERWRDDAALRIVRGDALGNFQRAGRAYYASRLAKLKEPVDRSEWAMAAQTVNAVNLPTQNALNFPAAILQPPYFDLSAPDVVNYGSIGATIGHEISHSFDDQGCQFDASGKLSDWWTPDDLAHFKAAAERLVSQYDAYQPLPGLAIHGRQVLSENIADVAGLSAAYDGYRKASGGEARPISGLTGDQQFFVAYAQSWREKIREPALRQQILTDGHSPAHYRALTVRNIDAWYQAFDVKPGQGLYLTPSERVRVW
jgi:putative endopeptidase